MADRDRIVWVVMTGEYSDLELEEVFSSQAAAEQWASLLGGEVHERKLLDQLPPHRMVYQRQGNIVPTPTGAMLRGGYENSWAVTGARIEFYKPVEVQLSGPVGDQFLRVFGLDKGRVDKAFNDAVAQVRYALEDLYPQLIEAEARAQEKINSTKGPGPEWERDSEGNYVNR